MVHIGQACDDLDVDKTFAVVAAASFAAGNVVYGAAALTGLWARAKARA